MRMEPTDGSIEAYRTVCKDLDRIWSRFSKDCDLSEAEYWTLLMIREGCSTQTEISEQLYMHKQTIHSALKQLIKKGLARLETKENNLRTKQILLTEAGIQFVEKYIDSMLRIEERAWTALETEERQQLILISQKFNRLLASELTQPLQRE